MAQDHALNGGWVIVLSFVVAFMLTAMPLPDGVHGWRPAWVAMMLVYWCMALPDRIGIGIGWMLGIMLDVQQGTVFGQNALTLAVIAYITIRYHQRLRVYPLTQQAVIVGSLVLIHLIIALWIKSLLGIPPLSWTFWMPALTSTLLWPWFFIILRDIRRKYRIA
jgi:rod shape-determining protein MreD